MTSHFAHKLWLKISAVLIGLFGPFLTLATMPAYSEPARWVLDLLAWPLDGFPSYTSPEIWFLSALSGGFLIGWGVLVWCLTVWVYDAAPEGVRKSMLVSAGAWFIVDSAGSITSGNWPNAFWNLALLIVIVGPISRPAKA